MPFQSNLTNEYPFIDEVVEAYKTSFKFGLTENEERMLRASLNRAFACGQRDGIQAVSSPESMDWKVSA